MLLHPVWLGCRLQEEALLQEARPGSAARLEDLDDYLEQLYEGLDEKVGKWAGPDWDCVINSAFKELENCSTYY
jgi:hypothetical protein